MKRTPSVERVFHKWDDWECTSAGMYEPAYCTKTDDHVFKLQYRDFLADLDWFQFAIDRVFAEWPISCENFLTNQQINRVAWIGQASACIELGLPSAFKGGFWLLSRDQQNAANELSENNLINWIHKHNADKKAGKRIRKDVGFQMLFRWDT
jgi:hypothetical protein